MPKASPAQTNFNGGEISPLLYGRVDVPRYRDSLAICQNYLPVIQGPMVRRPGTSYICQSKEQASMSILIPFQVSTDQAYMIEMSEQFISYYKDYFPLTSSQFTITLISNGNPIVVSAPGHTFSNLDQIIITGVAGMTQVNGRRFVVTGVSGNTFQLAGINGTSYDTYTSGGTAFKIVNTVTTFTEDELAAVQFVQSNDVLYVVHPDHKPFTISRTTATSFTVADISFEDGPYFDEDEQGVLLTFNTGPNRITASGVGPINDGQGFLSTDVGRLIRYFDSGVWVPFRITSVTSTTVVNVEVAVTTFYPANGDSTGQWRLGLWSNTTGYPAVITFHEDRLVLGGSAGAPTRFDGSNTSDYVNFAPSDLDGDIVASHAYAFVLNSNDVNKINWMTSDEQGLLIGTAGGEWAVTAADGVSAISALSVNAKKATSHGSEPIQAVQSGKSSIFVQRGARKVRELNFYFDVNGFRAADLTQLSEHITQSGIIRLAAQKLPQPIVWALRDDGVLLSMTYERDLDALKVGWSRHIIGGNFGAGDAVVESMAVIPTPDGDSEDLWIVVKRTVNGATVRHIENVNQIFDTNTDLEDAIFFDAALQYSGAETLTISGLNHLIGQTVGVFADNQEQASKTVSALGKITLDVPASTATIGLIYNSDGQALRIDAGSADGTSMGKIRRVERTSFNLLNSLGIKVGPDFDTLDDVLLTGEGGFDSDTGLFTGIHEIEISNDYDYDNMYCWRQSGPYPGTILGLYPSITTNDD